MAADQAILRGSTPGSKPESIGVRIRGLSKRFWEVQAVKGLTLDVREGEIFGLLGPNGAGKTTTLAMLATLLPPTSGDAEIFGHRISKDVAAVRRAIGIAPQEISLYPRLTGQENLLFFGRLQGVGGRRLRDRVRELLERAGLTGRKDDLVESYSGGMQRRLNLVCSLVHDPRVVLLDEPTVGVDPQSRENLFRMVQEISAAGATVIYTTHYMDEAERLCDRIAIVDEGRLVALGTLDELLALVGTGEVIEIHERGAGLERVFMHLTGHMLRD
jgi:ABC-2 type transport system ATP-binding protein